MDRDKIIKKLAYESIASKLKNTPLTSKYDIIKEFPEFIKPQATFVTLKKDGKLRGCIGSLVAHQEFYDDLVINAQKAAFEDPRFKPLNIDELDKIEIEISLLTKPTLVEYSDIDDLKSKIKISVDGIILKYQNNQATFLPSVWEDIPDFDTFFAHLCLKARLNQNCLSLHPAIYKYQAIKIK